VSSPSAEIEFGAFQL